jgi:predicted lysophospholipase L1 biosynthesis ABC-type transport system permease subunit
MKTLKKIDIMSFAKFQTILMAMIGLLVGVMVAFFGFIFQAFAGRFIEEGAHDFGMFGMGLGMAALFILPLIYAVMGFITGVIGGALFNLVCKISGGIKVELE